MLVVEGKGTEVQLIVRQSHGKLAADWKNNKKFGAYRKVTWGKNNNSEELVSF